MANLRQITFVLLFTLSAVLWLACNRTQNCLPQNNKCRIEFLTVNDYNQSESINIDTFSLYITTPSPKSVYEAASQISTCELPLSYQTQQIGIAIQSNHIWDSIEINYTSLQTFQNTECGFSTSYHLKSVRHTRHKLESVHINNPTIDENENTNLHFVFSRDL